MNRKNENYSDANNSNVHVTPDCESVSLLFGLSPNQAYHAFGHYYDNEKMCSVALIEMVEACQRAEEEGDASTNLYISKSIIIAVELDKMNFIYTDFQEEHGDDESSDYNPYDDQTVLTLHKHLIGIIKRVNELGGIDKFNQSVIYSIGEIRTKQAYQDMVAAALCVNSIYAAYRQNILALHKRV